jgi:hypothetical protein
MNNNPTDNDRDRGRYSPKSSSSSCLHYFSFALHVFVTLLALALAAYSFKKIEDLEREIDLMTDGTSGIVRLTMGRPKSEPEAFSLFRGSGVWHWKRLLPEHGRSDFHAVSVGEDDGTDDFIYIFGGIDESGNALNSAYKYDTIIDTNFTAIAAMPEARARYASAVMKNDANEYEVWIIGGILNVTDDTHGDCPLVYNVRTNAWRKESRCLPSIVKDGCASTGSDGAIYLIGGYGADYEILKSVYKLAGPLATEWVKTSTDLPDPRGDMSCAALGDNIYASGGWHDPSASGTYVSQTALFVLDVTTGIWSENYAGMKYGRGDFALVANPKTNSLLAIGGETNTTGSRSHSTLVAQHFVEEYFVEHDDWEVRQMMPTARFRFGAALRNGVYHVFGGHIHEGEYVDALRSHEAYYPLDHPDVWVSVQKD